MSRGSEALSSRGIRGHRLLLAALGILAAGGYLLAALFVFDGAALHVDALTQRVQANLFSSGRTTLSTFGLPEFFGSLLLVQQDGALVSQFPPGWAALLAVGDLAGLPWAVSPILGAAAVLALYGLSRSLGDSRAVALGAAALLATSPWWAINAGSQMNHLPASTLLIAGWAALARGLGPRAAEPRRPLVLAAGLAMGAAASIRPLDAAAFALGGSAWVGWRTLRAGSGAAGPWCLGLGLAGSALLIWNWTHFGGPLAFGYSVQWGEAHGLGFHPAPWGPDHTPARALRLTGQYLMGVERHLIPGPFPVLAAAGISLGLGIRQSGAGDRSLLLAALFLVLGYFFYWHEGVYLGPRFLLPLAPLICLWLARLPALLWGGLPALRPWLPTAAAGLLLLGVLSGWVVFRDTMLPAYGNQEELRRIDPAASVRAAGIQDAVILVAGGWASAIRAQLWGLGISPLDTQRLVDAVDLCTLDGAVWRLQRERASPPVVARTLLELERGSDPEPPSSSPPAACRQRAEFEKRGGFSLLPFLAVQGEGGNVFARDLHEENRTLLAVPELRDRPVWVALPRRDGEGVGIHLRPLNPDSATSVWGYWDRLQRARMMSSTTSR